MLGNEPHLYRSDNASEGGHPLKSLLTPDGMLEAKILAMVVLGAVAAAIAFLPLGFSSYLDRRSTSEKANTGNRFSFMFPFGGGVLLCTIFLHLLPEVAEKVEDLYKKQILSKPPLELPELLTCCGFFMMLFVDGITHSILHKFYHSDTSPQSKPAQTSSSASTQHVSEQNGAVQPTVTCPTDGVRHRGQSTAEDPTPNESNHQHNHTHHFDHLIVSKVSLVRCFLFVLALSVHEFFEGLAIGLESKVNQVYFLCAAVASHKLVIALCIGVEMVTTRIKFGSACTYILTYSGVSPVGILVGMLVLRDAASGSEVNAIASALLQGLATGTLLYVVFFEVLSKTMGKNETGLLKIVAVLIGFLTMLFLQLQFHEEENED